MNNLKYENFKNICRICMSNSDTNFNKNSAMLEIFHKLTDVHFESNNELPQQICLKCFDFINEIHSFSMTCKQTHSVLIECLNDYKNIGIKQESEIIEEIKTEDEITIEEHKIEFIKVEVDNDWETNDVTERTNDLLLPLLSKIHTKNEENQFSEPPSVSEISNNVQIHRYKCEQCEKSFRQSNNLIRHKRVHSGERPYKCPQCEKSFSQSATLIKHERVHSGERPFKCDQCEKSFTGTGTLKVHKRTHSGERIYKCDQCEKSFKHSNTLVMHKRAHSGERPYKCDQCEKAFTKLSDLTVHKRVHSGMRPYKCEHCDKSFTQLRYMKKHKRTHSGERSYNCDQCNKSFNRSDTLKSHKRSHNRQVH